MPFICPFNCLFICPCSPLICKLRKKEALDKGVASYLCSTGAEILWLQLKWLPPKENIFCMMLFILLYSFFVHNQLLYIYLQQLLTDNPCLITCKRNSSLYIIHKTEMSQWFVTPKKTKKQSYLTTAIANVFSTSALLYIFYSRNKMKCILWTKMVVEYQIETNVVKSSSVYCKLG